MENDDAYLRKAEESIAGAASELANGRFNNCANRCYYACFQAAVSMLISEGIKPGSSGLWSHASVQALFVGHFINRRKSIPSEFRDILHRALTLPQTADYDIDDVSEIQAVRVLRRARTFVTAFQSKGR
jgi:uncharacterized protein (UPF0332 family)